MEYLRVEFRQLYIETAWSTMAIDKLSYLVYAETILTEKELP